jgi:hypothetical protein
MPTTRSKSLSIQNALKPVSKAEWATDAEWIAIEALVSMKKLPMSALKQKYPQRPQRSCATYTPGTFADMEE